MAAPLVHLIAAARPNFMKVAPLYRALEAEGTFAVRLVHTGQHYDANMSAAFFEDFGLPPPDHHLGVGSGTHAEQTGRTMMAYEPVCGTERPACTIVVGDVNATAAVAMVCAKLRVPVAHLEAGLRSGDRSMPEEINRVVTDAIADILWTPSADADENLRREGIPETRIDRVGNIMIDAFELQRARIEADGTRAGLGLAPKAFGVVTLHRPSNVDVPAVLAGLVEQLVSLAAEQPLVFPVHPRTRARLESLGLLARLADAPGMRLLEPVGYIQFMSLVTAAAVVITDSGGVQEETTYLDIPCLTLRPNTERPITISQGTNRLVAPAELVARAREALAGQWPRGRRPALWDGQTAGRCVLSLKRQLGGADTVKVPATASMN